MLLPLRADSATKIFMFSPPITVILANICWQNATTLPAQTAKQMLQLFRVASVSSNLQSGGSSQGDVPGNLRTTIHQRIRQIQPEQPWRQPPPPDRPRKDLQMLQRRPTMKYPQHQQHSHTSSFVSSFNPPSHLPLPGFQIEAVRDSGRADCSLVALRRIVTRPRRHDNGFKSWGLSVCCHDNSVLKYGKPDYISWKKTTLRTHSKSVSGEKWQRATFWK